MSSPLDDAQHPVAGASALIDACEVHAALPDFLFVREAAEVLRLGRNTTYELAKLFIETAGSAGIPAIRFGRSIRIPRVAIEAILGGRVTWPPPGLPDRLLASCAPTAAPLTVARPSRAERPGGCAGRSRRESRSGSTTPSAKSTNSSRVSEPSSAIEPATTDLPVQQELPFGI